VQRVTRVEVVVIGAGPGGLAAAAALKEHGINAVVVDGAPRVGSSWRAHYDRLHLHTPRRWSGLPGHPIPRSAGRWVSRKDVVRYLESYAAHHRLELHLGTAVTAVERGNGDATQGLDAAGRWVVRLADGSSLGADHVVVATGYNHTPVDPDWPGLDGFPGDVVPARDFRNGRPFAGRDVLVVGTGNTGMEIATDLAEHGATRVWLSVRTPPHILPRSRLGWPAQATGILVRRLPPRLVDRVAGVLAVVQEPDLTEYGMPRAGKDLYSRVLVGRIPVQDVGIVAAIRSRQVEPVAAVEAFDGPDVVLSDGTLLQPSAVVVATGYRAGLEPLVGHLRVLDDRGLPVVRGPHEPVGAPGLWFTGYTNPISGALRELRIDAERIATAISREAAASRV
jgi:cation diffusion facilitator CzcD-associated flavoprotein CzcO